MQTIGEILTQGAIEASAPCRIDMGGTLDLSTFYLPLHHLEPCTFNLALNLRTQVRLAPFRRGAIKISSRGFESVEFDADKTPFAHPLGLMMAVAAFFQAEGVHIDIASSSPPRSALGGSSVAAVALIWAFSKARAKAGDPMPDRRRVALLAHAIEQSVAGVPCGIQDQLAAVYGGVNAWFWQVDPDQPLFRREALMSPERASQLADEILVAYCGTPHLSKDVNATWVRQFLDGENREVWHRIAACSRNFVDAMAKGELAQAQEMMNQETEIRCRLTPEVLDDIGVDLVAAARHQNCGARFTGAGGGGCVWALGSQDQLAGLRPSWDQILNRQASAGILSVGIDTDGLL